MQAHFYSQDKIDCRTP